MVITQKTHEALQELIHTSYVINARIDRMKSVLVADLSYNETSEIVHEFIAHYFSNGIGDALSDKCLERYNISVIFGDIPVMDKKYSSVEEVLTELLDVVIDYQYQLAKCSEIVLQNLDTNVYSDLMNFNVDFNQIIDQVILMVDKINLYKDNPTFDAHLKSDFFLLGGKLNLLNNISLNNNGSDD